MSAFQTFCVLSTLYFFFLGVFVSSSTAVSMFLKAFSWSMAVFGAFVTASAFGLVLANGVRLV